jgi:hypothetical protein
MFKYFAAIAAIALIQSATAMELQPSPAGAEVYIISPANNAKVKSPVTVVFGVKGMGIAPAGIKFENTGHHHILIDSDLPAKMDEPLAANEKSVHYGKGQTEASLTLTPGKHTLQLVFGDYLHTPHNPPLVSRKITIDVVK